MRKPRLAIKVNGGAFMDRGGRSLASFFSILTLIAAEWTGRAFVIDGDTIVINRTRLRLLAMDAPEMDQTCTDGLGREYACGEAAKLYLEGTTRDHVVTCSGDKLDYWGRPLVDCRLGDLDLNRMMVRAGWAVSAYGRDYVGEHNEAAKARVGIWAGSFVGPRTWRRSGNALAPMRSTNQTPPQPLSRR